jgi:hypothetical protein
VGGSSLALVADFVPRIVVALAELCPKLLQYLVQGQLCGADLIPRRLRLTLPAVRRIGGALSRAAAGREPALRMAFETIREESHLLVAEAVDVEVSRVPQRRDMVCIRRDRLGSAQMHQSDVQRTNGRHRVLGPSHNAPPAQRFAAPALRSSSLLLLSEEPAFLFLP